MPYFNSGDMRHILGSLLVVSEKLLRQTIRPY